MSCGVSFRYEESQNVGLVSWCIIIWLICVRGWDVFLDNVNDPASVCQVTCFPVKTQECLNLEIVTRRVSYNKEFSHCLNIGSGYNTQVLTNSALGSGLLYKGTFACLLYTHTCLFIFSCYAHYGIPKSRTWPMYYMPVSQTVSVFLSLKNIFCLYC